MHACTLENSPACSAGLASIVLSTFLLTLPKSVAAMWVISRYDMYAWIIRITFTYALLQMLPAVQLRHCNHQHHPHPSLQVAHLGQLLGARSKATLTHRERRSIICLEADTMSPLRLICPKESAGFAQSVKLRMLGGEQLSSCGLPMTCCI